VSHDDLPSSSSPVGLFSHQAHGGYNASSKLMIQVPQYTNLGLESLTPMSLSTLFSTASPQGSSPVAAISPANYLHIDPSSSMPLLGNFSSSMMIRGSGQTSLRMMNPYSGGLHFGSSYPPQGGYSSNYGSSGLPDNFQYQGLNNSGINGNGGSSNNSGISAAGGGGGLGLGGGGLTYPLHPLDGTFPDHQQRPQLNLSTFGRLDNIQVHHQGQERVQVASEATQQQQEQQEQEQVQQQEETRQQQLEENHQQQQQQQQQQHQQQQQQQQQQPQLHHQITQPLSQHTQHLILGSSGALSGSVYDGHHHLHNHDSNNQGLPSYASSSSFDLYSSAPYNPYALHLSAPSIAMLASTAATDEANGGGSGGVDDQDSEQAQSTASVLAAAAVSHLPNVLPFGERHPCVIAGCTSNFSNKAAMIRHVKAAHEGVRVSCIAFGCLATFTDNSNMRKHYRTVHEGNAPRVSCTVEGCVKTFVSEWDKKKHIRAIHDKIRVACPFEGCGVTFTAESAKQKHVQTTHFGVRVPCAFPGCTMTFYDRKAMRTHCANKHQYTF
jgi:hypothetical protein